MAAATGKTTTRSQEAKAEERRISQIGDFKNRMRAILELPSGLTVKARNPGGLQAFLDQNGSIPNSLMAIVQEGLRKGKAPDVEEFMKDGQFDPAMMSDMDTMLNVLVTKVIIEPPVLPVPKSEDDRSDEQLYADEIPLDDKMFLYQWVAGGTKDLETFRKQYDTGVASVAASASAVSAAQSAAGINPR